MDRECEDVMAVLEKTDSRQLFGHSFGGLTALQTAVRADRDQLDSVVVYDAAVSVDGSMPFGFLPSFVRSVERRQNARAIAELTRGLQIGRRLDTLPFGVTLAASWLGVNTVWKAECEVLPTVPREGSEALRLDGPASAYEPISTPAHFLVGEHSPDYFLKAATEISATLPAARVTVMPGLDHRGPLARPKPVAKAYLETWHATAFGER
jgi:pimeloyl-ACP methyl ester carboxylesterase